METHKEGQEVHRIGNWYYIRTGSSEKTEDFLQTFVSCPIIYIIFFFTMTITCHRFPQTVLPSPRRDTLVFLTCSLIALPQFSYTPYFPFCLFLELVIFILFYHSLIIIFLVKETVSSSSQSLPPQASRSHEQSMFK